jgi:hypothetical protein
MRLISYEGGAGPGPRGASSVIPTHTPDVRSSRVHARAYTAPATGTRRYESNQNQIPEKSLIRDLEEPSWLIRFHIDTHTAVSYERGAT